MKSEDVLILLKLAATMGSPWTEEFISTETGHSPEDVRHSIDNLLNAGLVSQKKVRSEQFKEFILFRLHNQFRVHPGKIVRGICTGAKPCHFFTGDLPYTSITVWPYEHGKELGYEVIPLSPHCCFAALNDPRLRHLLAITETMRIVGPDAGYWALSELNRFLEMKYA